MGQTAHPGRSRARRAVVPLVGSCLAAVPFVSGCGQSLSSATTTLAGVVDTRVVHADGSTVSGVNGLRLHAGDVVRTGPAGRAELHTRGRIVYEGSDAAVQVLDGARSDLRHGAVVIDAQHGPGLTVDVAGLRLATPGGSAVRAERSVTVRIAALAGPASLDSATGRHLDVTALTQAVVGGDALPDSTAGTPLRLTDDDGEARAVPGLVRDDLSLLSLAAGIDSTGDSTVRAVTAAWHSDLEPLPGGVARSEQVLPVVIAAATRADAATRYHDAVALRQAGASWGVVAHRLGTTASQVLVALQAFQRGVATGQVGTVPAALAYLTGRVGGSGAGGVGGSGSAGGSGSGGSGSGGSGSGGGGPSPSPSPTGSSDPVGGTIDKVLHLLPTPVPTPTPTSSSLLPLQLPTVSVGSLLTPAPAPSLPG